jgi:histidinol phosphatase-like enzyme
MAFSLTDINDYAIYMVMASMAELRNKNIELIKMLQTMDYHVLIITTNQPYDVLKKNLEKKTVSP